MQEDDFVDEKTIKNYQSHLRETEKLLENLNKIDTGHMEEMPDKTQNTDTSDSHEGLKGLSAASHIVSGVLVGLVLGYGFDYLLDIDPWGLVIMIPLGFCAGFLNMMRALKE